MMSERPFVYLLEMPTQVRLNHPNVLRKWRKQLVVIFWAELFDQKADFAHMCCMLVFANTPLRDSSTTNKNSIII